MKRQAFDETADPAEARAPEVRTYRCPAYGCPNAAPVSLNGGASWACYAHASAPSELWQHVTAKIRQGLPETTNWLPRPAPSKVPASAIPPHAGPAAWAYRLRWRHQQGERLTAAQVSMYAEAIARREGAAPTAGDAP